MSNLACAVLTASCLLLASLPADAQNVSFSHPSSNPFTTLLGGNIAWADFDCDGDMDALVTGQPPGSGSALLTQTILYRNNGSNQFAAVANTGLANVYLGGAAWADCNNDGWPDLALSGTIVTGMTTSTSITQVYKNNAGNGTFTAVGTFTALTQGSVAWGDYNNDGRKDLLVTGCTSPNSRGTTLVYKNNGNLTFTALAANLPGISSGEGRWGDYDNDGRLDILLTGGNFINNNSNPTPCTYLCRNNGNDQFSTVAAGLLPLSSSSGDFGDYDNDGRLDIVLIGTDSARLSHLKVYHNDPDGVFRDVALGLGGSSEGVVRWGDFDQDGFADIIVAGSANGTLYNNAQNDQFTASSYYFSAGRGCDLNLTDLNADGKLDFSVSGVSGASNYTNTLTTANAPPALPGSPRAAAAGDRVLLSWNAPTDDHTGSDGLTYNLRIGTSPNTLNILSPEANQSSGTRYVTAPGNAGSQNWQWLQLPTGTYYWNVQACDASWANSAFTTGGSFTIPGSSIVVHINSVDNVQTCAGNPTVLQAETYPAATAYQWYKDGAAISGATAPTYSVTAAGQYFVEARTTGAYTRSTNTITVTVSTSVSAPTATDGYGCAGTSITLSASCGDNSNSCQWYTAAGDWLHSGSTLTVSPAQTTSYLVKSYNATTQCYSSAVTVTANVRPSPPTPSGATRQSTCGAGDTLTLAVNPPPAPYLTYWYSQASGGSSIAAGNTLTLYNVTAPVTYYATTFDPTDACSSPSRLAVTGSVAPPVAPPVTQSAFPCTSGSTVTLTATPTPATLVCKWYNQETSGTMFHTGTTYPVTVTDPVVYFVAAFDATTGCESSERSPVAAAVRGITDAPVAQNATGYGSCRVTLYAVPPPNATTCRWYADPFKNLLLHTGSNFLTPTLQENSVTLYWVAGYNEDNQCEGSGMFQVSAITQTVPTVLVNPDQIYPVPNNVLEEEYNGVNLFTGDVNLTLPIASISGAKLSYTLNAFYNSRSASVTPYYTASTLGGLGWKLLDYPKIAYDAVKTRYFFLDGLAAYPLDTLLQSTDSITFAAPGKYATMTFTMRNARSGNSARTWSCINEKQEEYQFTATPGSLPNNGYLWSLTRLVDAARTDTLTFDYSTNPLRLNSIANNYNEKLSFGYQNSRLTEIIHYTVSGTNVQSAAQEKISLVYENNKFAPNPSFYLLTGINTYTNINYSTSYSGTWWYPAAPATVFEYHPTGATNPGALKTVTSPGGAKRTYSYLPVPYPHRTYLPVTGIATDAGHFVHYEGNDLDVTTPEEITYEGSTVSADSMYFQSNLTTVVPGKNVLAPLYTDASTSFEKGKHDDVFTNLDKDDLKKDYPLTGTHSLKFDGTFNLRATSRQFAINRDVRRVSAFESSLSNPVNENGSLDSITLSFFCLQTHENLDVDFYLDFTFYDDKKQKINDWGCDDKNYELQNQQYGQWVPFKLRFGVPSNARYFDFEFRGGSKLYGFDFYMDDVTVSGTESNVQGELQYFFFNGASAANLRHLPDAYVQGTEASMLKKLYYTGFESGQTWTSWLDISDGPADVNFNTEQRHTSYSGTYALRVADYKSDKANVKASSMPIPAGTDHVLLSFHYSQPQFPGMQVRFTWGCNNSSTQSQDLTLDGSYFIDPGYGYFQQVVPVNGATSFSFTIAVRDAGPKSDVNDFYIDDLTVQMLHGAGTLQPVNVQNPLLTGNSYLSRTFSNDYTELEVTSAVLVPAVMNNSTHYVQLKELNGTTSAAAHTGIETQYNAHGMPTASTWRWARTNADSSVTDVWTRTHFIYAKDIWSALQKNYADEIAVQWTEVSEDYFQTWSTTSGNVAQWKSFFTDGKTVWNPWRAFEMTSAATPSQIQAVVNGLSSPAYTPPPAQWIQILRTDSIRLQGNIVAALLNDSVPIYTQYSQRQVSLSSMNRVSIPVATFVNGSSRTCLYYGFEAYEHRPAGFSGNITTSYAFTGAGSAMGNSVSLRLNYDPAGAGTTSYVLGAFIMPQGGSFSFVVTATGGFAASQVFTIPDSLKNVWRYYEWVFTPPATATTLNFTVQSSPTFGLDDFRFSPVTSVLEATVYDITAYRTEARIGNNADVTRLLRNRSGGLHGVTGPGEVPVQLTSDFYSRNVTGNNDNFNPNLPNTRSSIEVAGGGTYFPMNDVARNTLWTFSTTTGSSFNTMQGFTLVQGSHVSLAASKLPANRRDCGISFRVCAPLGTSATPLFGLDLGGAGLAFSLSGQTLSVKTKASTSSWTTATNLDLPAYFSGGLALDVDLVLQNGLLQIWVNGQIVANSTTYSASQFTQLRFFCNSSSTSTFPSIQVSNICLFTDATLAATFEDGLGNPVQQQVLTDAGVVISETLYDRLNRPILQTREVAFAGVGLGYRATFVTGMNWETGYLSGDVNNARAYIEGGSQDEGYLYSRSIYLKSPQEKVSYQFNPGYDFALRSQTNWEKAKKWLYQHTGQIIEYGGYALQAAGYALDLVDCILEPEAAPLIIALDVADLIVTVAQIVDEYGGSASTKRQNSPITNYFYDRSENLVSVYLPNANKTDSPDLNQVVSYTYDFRNHLNSENAPEAGHVDYCWDNRDVLRFMADGNDRDSNRVRYIKYDRQQRMIEQGFMAGNLRTDLATLAQAANDPGYPGTGVPHQVLYTYVWDGATTGTYGRYLTRGRLTGCNAWSGGQLTSVVTYSYDVFGNISSRTQNGNALQYTYDVAGNLRKLEYPPFAGRNFKVLYRYNKLGQIDSVFTSEETAVLATMNYYPNGEASITQLNCKAGQGSIPLRYYYNAPGWLTSLTAGEHGSHSGTDDDYTTDYFGLDLNYNLLDDTWSDLMDQVYYNGNLVSSTLTPGSKATHLGTFKQAYQYDELGHLNSYGSTEICNLLPESPCSTMVYTFDLNGNLQEEQAWADLTSLKAGWSWKRHYDKTKNRVDRLDCYYAHEVVNYPDRNTYRRDTFFLTYDHAGNLTRQDYRHYNTYKQGENHGTLNKTYTRELTYNDDHQVLSVKHSRTGRTDTLVTYTYTAEGYRYTRTLTVGSSTMSTTTYVRGLNGELLMELNNVGGAASARYYVYADDSPFATYFDTANQMQSWFVLTDPYGSATALVNRANKNVDASFVYDAYGAPQLDRCYGTDKYTLLFNGQEYDPQTRLYNFPARTYDPLLKIFLQPDPARNNLALPYAYTDFDPVNYVDPDGRARLHAPDRKNGQNTLKIKKAAIEATNPSYAPGDLIKFLQTRNLKNYDAKAAFIVMMESKNANIMFDLAQLRKQGKSVKGHPAGPYQVEWEKLKDWLREGKRHEMAPVSRIDQTVRLGIPMERFQQLTFPTNQTFFEAKITNPNGTVTWSGIPIAHGAVGSPAAHQELRDLLDTTSNAADYEDKLALWMSGEMPNQQYRLHTNSLNLLPATRTVAKGTTSVVLRFFR